jgi:hypothetical protein
MKVYASFLRKERRSQILISFKMTSKIGGQKIGKRAKGHEWSKKMDKRINFESIKKLIN